MRFVRVTERRSEGFTLVELLLVLVISGVVMGGIYAVFASQLRSYTKVRERTDVHMSLRSAAALLAWELRGASAEGGDLRDLQTDRLTLRAVQGTGVVCVKHADRPRYGLWATDGDLTTASVDSALVFQPRSAGTTDDRWRPVAVAELRSPTADVATCAWADGRAAERELRLAVGSVTDTAGIAVGSPVRLFREVTYGILTRDGREWLGRRTGGSWEVFAGPLETDGLRFTYLDASGGTTADPAQVAAVEIRIRAESHDRSTLGSVGFESDSLALRVALRN